MKLFFEGKKYTIEVLSKYFRNHNEFLKYWSDDTITLNCIGYYYNVQIGEPCYVLPKVFIIDNLAFGSLPIKEEEPIEVNSETLKEMKLHEWEESVLYELPVWLYRAIDKYNNKHKNYIVNKEKAQSIITHRGKEGEQTLLDIVLSLRKFYKDNQNLFVFIYKQIHSGYNKVNWSKTVKKCQPIIDGDKIAYPYVVNKKKEINFDEELLVLFFSTLRHISSKYGFPFILQFPYTLYSKSEFTRLYSNGSLLNKLRRIKGNYYNDKLIQLWNLLYAFYSKANNIKGSKFLEEFLLVKDFNIVFEDMIDELLTDKNLPPKLKNQKDGKEVDHLFRHESLSTKFKDIYYIGDSKYYRDGANPEGVSVYKQFTYARNVVQLQIDWYNKDNNHPDYLNYRDELTEGYNITPNFFITGMVRNSYRFTEDKLKLDNEANLRNFDKYFSSHYKDRLFDRDTLFLLQYNINFLFVLNTYIQQSETVKNTFKNKAKEKFKENFITHIEERFDFYSLTLKENKDIEEVVSRHFRKILGKVFCPYSNNKNLLILALANDAIKSNNELLISLEEDFYIADHSLGEDFSEYRIVHQYLEKYYASGILNAAESDSNDNSSIEIRTFEGFKQYFNSYSFKSSILVGCYKSNEHLNWIKEQKLYNVRFDNRMGAVKRNSQVVSAKILVLYNVNNPLEYKTFLLSEKHHIWGREKMEKNGYPNVKGDKYYIYNIIEEISSDTQINIQSILDAEGVIGSKKGTPVYVYLNDLETYYR